MKQKLTKNKVFLIFSCGFFIGICLEIVLIGTGRRTFAPLQDSLRAHQNITCLVLIKHPHLRYVNSSKKTWLKHCSHYRIVDIRRPSKNKAQQVSSGAEEVHHVVQKHVTCHENGDAQEVPAKSAWDGLCKALHFVDPRHLQWLVIIPDSSIVLVENLRHFVRDKNCDDGHYYGYAVKNYQADYNVLSAGIVMSRGALRKLLEKFPREEDCDDSGKHWKNEDLYLGKFLKHMDILPKDSRDEEGKGRFHGYNMNNILWPGKFFRQSEYSKKALYPVSQGFNCCSPFLITLDVSDPDSMHNLYFLLYKLKTVHNKLPPKAKLNRTEGTFWKDFLRKEGYNQSAIENMTNEEYYNIWEKKLPSRLINQEMRNFIENNRDHLD